MHGFVFSLASLFPELLSGESSRVVSRYDLIRELFLEFPQRLLEDVHEQKRTETSRRTLSTKKPRVICKSVEQCHAN